MLAIPSLDIRDGACVQIASSATNTQPLRFEDPVDVALAWQRLGFSRLQIVDVDAGLGHGSNADLLREIIEAVDVDVQVGGGVRDQETIDRLLAEGASAVIVGTRAVENPEWLADTAGRFPGQIIVAADVRGGRVVTRGWQRATQHDVVGYIEELGSHPLGGVLVTPVNREGVLAATDIYLMEDIADASDHPVFVAGGLTTINDLRSLADRGIAGAVLGAPLYARTLNPFVVAEEFGA